MGMADGLAGEYAVYRIDESGEEVFVNQYPRMEEAFEKAEDAKDASGEAHIIKRVDIKFMEDDIEGDTSEPGHPDNARDTESHEATFASADVRDRLVEAYEESDDDIEAQTVLTIADRFGIYEMVVCELHARGWEV